MKGLEFLTVKIVNMSPKPGKSTNPFDVIEEAKWYVHQTTRDQDGNKALGVVTFNNVRMTISDESSIPNLMRDYERALEGCIIPDIGPVPKSRLSGRDYFNDKTIKAANTKLVKAQEIQLVPDNNWEARKLAWANFPFGLASLSFAKRWTRLAQVNAISGQPIASNTVIQAAKEAGLPTTNLSNGVIIIREVVKVLRVEWQYGDALSELADADDKTLSGVFRQIQPKITANSFCGSRSPQST
jgi:hypothetical protein